MGSLQISQCFRARLTLPHHSIVIARPGYFSGRWDLRHVLARRWVAYASDKTGATEIDVRPFPDAAGKWIVSNTRLRRLAATAAGRGPETKRSNSNSNASTNTNH